MSDIFEGNGGSMRDDGTVVRYRVFTFETRSKLYDVRIYETGEKYYFVNCRPVAELPATPGTKKLLAHVSNLEMEEAT